MYVKCAWGKMGIRQTGFACAEVPDVDAVVVAAAERGQEFLIGREGKSLNTLLVQIAAVQLCAALEVPDDDLGAEPNVRLRGMRGIQRRRTRLTTWPAATKRPDLDTASADILELRPVKNVCCFLPLMRSTTTLAPSA